MTYTDRRLTIGACLIATVVGSAAVGSQTKPAPLLNHNDRSVLAIAKVYGFVIGQNLAFAELERRYPELKTQTTLARLAFDAAFPDLLKVLEAELGAVVGPEAFPAFREGLLQKIEAVRQPFGDGAPDDFLRQVHARAKGEGLEPDVRGYMLATRYAHRPASEFTDGFRERFETDGTGKAQGLRLALQLPQSWLAQEGERPHIVQRWTSEFGTGLSTIMLDVRDTGGDTPSAQELAAAIKSGEIRQDLASLGTVRSVSQVSVEKQPGLLVEYSMTQERVGVRLVSMGTLLQIFFRGKAIGIMCMASRPEADRAAVPDAWARLQPLCRQVANSLVLPQAY